MLLGGLSVDCASPACDACGGGTDPGLECLLLKRLLVDSLADRNSDRWPLQHRPVRAFVASAHDCRCDVDGQRSSVRHLPP